jgi:hypothetical protein
MTWKADYTKGALPQLFCHDCKPLLGYIVEEVEPETLYEGSICERCGRTVKEVMREAA